MKRIILALSLCVAALAQTATYPSAVATDAQLKLAKNNIETTLRSTMSLSDTVVTVADASNLAANMLLTIDREVMSVSSVSGNNLTVVRAFDNTTAATHRAGAKVYGYVVAWHHNALAAEVKAIEAALGPSLSNIPANAALVNVANYAWSPQTPGGTLSAAGGIQSVTLTPCPNGVAAANVEHYLYISGGTGTAEAVKILGGTCTSGAASGTIFVNVDYDHSGAWQVSTATAYIQEAFYATSGATAFVVPAGIHTVYAPTTFTRNQVSLTCPGRWVCQITKAAGNFDILRIGDDSTRLSTVGVSNVSFIGTYGVTAQVSGYAINVRNAGDVAISNVLIFGNDTLYRGVNFYRCTDCSFFDGEVQGLASRGFDILGTGSGEDSSVNIKINRNSIHSLGSDAINAGDHSSGIYITENEIYSLTDGWAFNTESRTSAYCCVWIKGNDIDTSEDNGCSGGCDMGAINLKYVNLATIDNKGMGGSTTSAKPVFKVQSTSTSITFNNGNVNAVGTAGTVGFTGMSLDGTDVLVTGATINGSSTATGLVTIGTNARKVSLIANKFTATSTAAVSFVSGEQYTYVGDNSYADVTFPALGTPHVTSSVARGSLAGNIPQLESASTITLPPYADLFTIIDDDGAQAIATMNGFWYGRVVSLQFIGSSPAGVTTGGNFVNAKTVTQNQSITCTYFGVNWVCVGP